MAAMRDRLAGGVEERKDALVELDRWLAEQVGVPASAAVRFAKGEESGFDPVTWTVSLPVGLTDPEELA